MGIVLTHDTGTKTCPHCGGTLMPTSNGSKMVCRELNCGVETTTIPKRTGGDIDTMDRPHVD